MDVRCENCQTEYELDPSRLQPGGVTVKCTACGHMFKVRKRTPTLGPRASSPPASSPQASSPPTLSSDVGGKDRTWLVRLEDGEIKTCRELAALQQWIVAGDVGRAAEISRTGKTWKKLGEVAELEDLFEVADKAGRRRNSSLQPGPDDGDRDAELQQTTEWTGEARSARRPSSAHPRLLPSRGSGPPRSSPRPSSIPPPPPAEETATAARRQSRPLGEVESAAPVAPLAASDTSRGTGVTGARHDPTGSASPPSTRSPTAPPSPPSLREPERAAGRAERDRGPTPSPIADPEAEQAAMNRLRADKQETGAPAPAIEPRRFHLDDEGPSGPTGGLARGIPTDDVAFGKGGYRPPPERPWEADVSEPAARSRGGGGVGLWIVAFSLAVMAAAVVVIYVFVFRVDGPGSAQAAIDAGAAGPDAAVVAAATDGGMPTVDPSALAAAHAAILGGLDEALADAAEALEGADDHLESVIARSQVHAARAQLLLDRAALEGGDEGRRLTREAAEHAAVAKEVASRSRELARDAVGSLVATGDALRVSGQRARDVRRPLRRAVTEEPSNIDAQLALALVLVGEGRARQARQSLEELAGRAEAQNPADPRPRVQLALLALEDGRDDGAREHADQVLAIAPDHEVAHLIVEILDERDAVVAEDDPMPREEDAPASAPPVSYDGLLERANELAERGRCGEASNLFRSALEVQESGVEALTGLAYCHLDSREFASAHARFSQALAVSARYQPALYGVAEAYQQQGLDDRAIDAYERYLELHPSGTRSEMARRQIARLGGEQAPDSEPDPESDQRDDDSDGSDDEAKESEQAGDAEAAGDDDDDDEPRPFLSDE